MKDNTCGCLRTELSLFVERLASEVISKRDKLTEPEKAGVSYIKAKWKIPQNIIIDFFLSAGLKKRKFISAAKIIRKGAAGKFIMPKRRRIFMRKETVIFRGNPDLRYLSDQAENRIIDIINNYLARL